MNKLLLFVLLTIMLIGNSTYAETVKSSKHIKSSDKNQTMTDDEFMKQFMALDQREKDAKADLEASKKLGKTLDELNKLVGVDKEK